MTKQPGSLPSPARSRQLVSCAILFAVLHLSGWARAVDPAAPADPTTNTPAGAEDRGAHVAVLFNLDYPGSREVATYYARRRNVPTNQCIGLHLPKSEVISRADYESSLEHPLVSELKSRGLIKTREEIQPATENRPGRVVEFTTESRIRYLTVCYGVPLRIAEDKSRSELVPIKLPEPYHRNGAAVDADLTVLPLLLTGISRNGPIANIWYGTTNADLLEPVRGLFVVGRLDGPTLESARALVDRALEAEQNGLLGRGYFDIRSITSPTYQPGDQWISNAWLAVSHYGFDTALDTRPETMPAGLPLSHVAFYAGWYDANVSGPFARPSVEFMPGAVAYHLHSYSAASLRTTNHYWVGPLVARGVTATMGMVDEPYLDGTPEIGMCLTRLLYSGFTWGEAAIASQRLLSWQLTVVGDPLYRPFAMNALERLKSLARRRLGQIDWELVTLYNRKRALSRDLPGVIAELEKEPRIHFSPILQEKLADWLLESGEPGKAARVYQRAARSGPSPEQRRRLLWNAASAYDTAHESPEAYECYQEFAAIDAPAYEPDHLYGRLKALALALHHEKAAKHWTSELDRLKSGGVKETSEIDP